MMNESKKQPWSARISTQTRERFENLRANKSTQKTLQYSEII